SARWVASSSPPPWPSRGPRPDPGDPVSSQPSDLIELRGLQVVGICGALPEERVRAQPLEVDLDVEADLALAGGTDRLADTIDYGALCDAVATTIAGGSPELLEYLA